MSHQQNYSFKFLILFLFLVLAGYNAGNIIVTLFANYLLLADAGFISSCASFLSITVVFLIACFMARPLGGYLKGITVDDFFKKSLMGFIGFLLLFVFIWGWERYTYNTSGQELLKTLNFGESVDKDFWLIMGIVLMSPLLEELVFRWLFYASIRNSLEQFLSSPLAIGIAAFVSSMLFVSIHGAPEQASQALPLLVMGLVFALIYQVTNSLLAVFVAHGLNNALTIFIDLASLNTVLSAKWLYLWLFAAVVLGVLLIALLHYAMKIKVSRLHSIT